MDIRERINKISEYFLGMNVAPSQDGAIITYVEVSFPKTWLIMESTADNYQVQYAPNENKTGFYFWSDSSDACEQIFNAIEDNVRVNKEAESKAVLLKQKIDELTKLFVESDYDLKTLSTLEFKLDIPKVKTPKPKSKKVKEDKPEEPEVVNTPEEETQDSEGGVAE